MSQRTASAAVYCRISKDRDGTALGVDRQERACRKLARERGWNVVATFTDNDVSAYSGKRRAGYEALLDSVKSGQVSAIVAMDPDRLHRSPRELETFIDVIEAHSVKIATVHSGELDLSTAAGRMTARVVGAVARHESEHKSERIRAQREDAARKGEPNGGGRTFGYSPQLDIVPKEAAAIRDAVKRLLSGEGTKSIARRWNTKGLRAVKGGEWTPQSVKQCVLAPRLAGLRVHRGEVVATGAWDAIIARDQHERVVALFAARRTGVGRPPTTLLGGGFLRCGLCETPMQSAGIRYECRSGTGLPGCGQVAVSKSAVEALVIDRVLSEEHHGAFVARAKRADGRKPVADVGTKITKAEARLVELAELFGDGTLSKAEWLAAKAKVNEQLDSLRGSLSLSEGQRTLAPFVAKGLLQAKWPTMGRDEQRRILASVIDHLVVHPSRTGPKFSEDRVEWHLVDAD